MITLKLLHQQGTQQGTFYWLEQVTCTRLKSMGRGHTLLPQEYSTQQWSGRHIHLQGRKKIGTQPYDYEGFPGGSVGKKSASNVGDLGSIPGLGRSPGEGNGYPLQYSGLENSMEYTVVRGVAKSNTTEPRSLSYNNGLP